MVDRHEKPIKGGSHQLELEMKSSNRNPRVAHLLSALVSLWNECVGGRRSLVERVAVSSAKPTTFIYEPSALPPASRVEPSRRATSSDADHLARHIRLIGEYSPSFINDLGSRPCAGVATLSARPLYRRVGAAHATTRLIQYESLADRLDESPAAANDRLH